MHSLFRMLAQNWVVFRFGRWGHFVFLMWYSMRATERLALQVNNHYIDPSVCTPFFPHVTLEYRVTVTYSVFADFVHHISSFSTALCGSL